MGEVVVMSSECSLYAGIGLLFDMSLKAIGKYNYVEMGNRARSEA